MFWRWQIAPHVQNRFTAPRGAAGTEDGTRRSREEVPSKRYRERVPVLFRRSSNRGTHTDNHRYMIYIDLVYSYQINTNVYCNIIYIYIYAAYHQHLATGTSKSAKQTIIGDQTCWGVFLYPLHMGTMYGNLRRTTHGLKSATIRPCLEEETKKQTNTFRPNSGF